MAILGAAGGLFVLHALEIWLYAAFYLMVGALSGLEAALYFSTSSYTTVGYGDVVLDERWRLIGAIEGANGLILLGWSTAFFVAIVGTIRGLEVKLRLWREIEMIGAQFALAGPFVPRSRAVLNFASPLEISVVLSSILAAGYQLE